MLFNVLYESGDCLSTRLSGKSLEMTLILHFYKAADDIVYILNVYAKSKKGDLTKAEQNALKKLVEQL
jgi:hypothetical protein